MLAGWRKYGFGSAAVSSKPRKRPSGAYINSCHVLKKGKRNKYISIRYIVQGKSWGTAENWEYMTMLYHNYDYIMQWLLADNGRWIMIAFCMLIVLPLCMLRHLRQLEYTGAAGTIIVLWMTVAIIVNAAQVGTLQHLLVFTRIITAYSCISRVNPVLHCSRINMISLLIFLLSSINIPICSPTMVVILTSGRLVCRL